MIVRIPTKFVKGNIGKPILNYTTDEVERILVNALCNIQVMFEQLNIPAEIEVNYRLDKKGVIYKITYNDKTCGTTINLD